MDYISNVFRSKTSVLVSFRTEKRREFEFETTMEFVLSRPISGGRCEDKEKGQEN